MTKSLFNECNGEHLFVYAKIEHLIPELRALFDSPDFLGNLETVVKRIPDYEKKLAGMKVRIKKFMEMRAEREAKTQAARLPAPHLKQRAATVREGVKYSVGLSHNRKALPDGCAAAPIAPSLDGRATAPDENYQRRVSEEQLSRQPIGRVGRYRKSLSWAARM